MKKYFDNRRSKALGTVALILDIITILVLVGGVISFFVGMSEGGFFALSIYFLVLALCLWITNAFLKGFEKLVETAELQQADIFKRNEENNSQNKEAEK